MNSTREGIFITDISGNILKILNARLFSFMKEGRWHCGFLALNPVKQDTQYAITVNISNI